MTDGADGVLKYDVLLDSNDAELEKLSEKCFAGGDEAGVRAAPTVARERPWEVR